MKRPEGIGSVTWMHMDAAERRLTTSEQNVGDYASAKALQSIAHSLLALLAHQIDTTPEDT